MGDLSQHFSRKEFECQCGMCGFDTADYELVLVLEGVREIFGPVHIHSGCRCHARNEQIGGALMSQHTQGKAADIGVVTKPADEVADYLEHRYPDKYGIGRYDGFTHIDVRNTKARWDNRTV